MYSVNIVYKCLCNLCIFSCFFLFCLLLFSTMIGEYRCVYIEDRRRDYCCLVKPAGSEPSDARPNCANLMIVSRPSRAVRRAPVRVAITTRVDSRRTPIEACCRVYALPYTVTYTSSRLAVIRGYARRLIKYARAAASAHIPRPLE